MNTTGPWTLLEFAEPVSLVRLPAGVDLPEWADGLPLTSVTWTARETSVLCPTACLPDSPVGIMEGPFTAFELSGDLTYQAAGVLYALTLPLAEAQVPALAVSTFNTNWVLIPAQLTQAAKASWSRAGHHLVDVTAKHPAAGGAEFVQGMEFVQGKEFEQSKGME